MGRIKLRYVYSDLVEHYLRAVIRQWDGYIPEKWYEFTAMWLSKLSPEDREFIGFVFDKRFYYAIEGLACYKPKEENADKPSSYAFEYKRERLMNLEKQFALEGGLVSHERKNFNRH